MSAPRDPNRWRRPDPSQPGGPLFGQPQSSRPPQPGEPDYGQAPQPPEIPKKIRRQPTIAILIGVAVLLIIALTRLGGGPANISATTVGPLTLGKSSRTAMENFATGQVKFWFKDKGSPPVKFTGQLWRYKCIGQAGIPGQACRTLFGITNGRVATVETSDTRYHAFGGIGIGTSLTTALAHSHGRFSGWQARCPHITLIAPSGHTFVLLVSRSSFNPQGFVSEIYASATPSSFSYCPS
jgi:hypothetical protein